MTGDPTHENRPSPGPAPDGSPPPENRDSPATHDSWAALSRDDRSNPEEPLTDESQTPPEPESRPRIWPRVVGVLVLLLGAGGAWVWQNPGFIENSVGSVFPGTSGRDTKPTAIKALEDRVARLEQQPSTADLAERLGSLERRGQGPSTSQVDLRPLMTRLDALEANARAGGSGGSSASTAGAPSGFDVRPLVARLDALERAIAERRIDPARVDALTGQVEALSAHDPAAEFRGKLDVVTQQLRDLAASETKLAASSDRAIRMARLGVAQIALGYGLPLGPIPDAPPALARFATVAPPTEASLRLDFTPASRDALKVSKADTEGKPFLDRVVARLQDFRLITVREGDRVLIGSPATATLAHAEALLDAGDLDGAVATVATLTGAPKEKMAAWLAKATSLQEARKALASLAGNG